MQKPRTLDGYSAEALSVVYSTCLCIATVLGDLADDRLVIVGGFVPQLIVPQNDTGVVDEPHVGTRDLDLGLSLALLDAEQYHEVAARLRGAGFAPDRNSNGQPTRQRWVVADHATGGVRIDFLIPPPPSPAGSAGADTGGADDRHMLHGGRLFGLEPDFAACIIPGLELAWRDRVRVSITGTTIRGEHATRGMWACGPGAFVVLKALAFTDRGEPKDAYDLYYIARYYGRGPGDVAAALAELRDHPLTARALEVLARDFTDIDAVGPRRVGEFLRRDDDELRADVVAFLGEVTRG